MPVSAEEIQTIIDGKPLPIDVPYPGDPDFQWFIRQPVDWMYDMAQAVKEAATAKALAEPEIASVKNLPASDTYQGRQKQQRKETEARIKELESQGDALMPEDAIELENLKDYLDRLNNPSKKFSRADEIANRYGTRAMENWLLPRLIVDAKGKPLFEMESEAGRQRWEALDRETKAHLRGPLYQALLLVGTAKNSPAGQNSSSS